LKSRDNPEFIHSLAKGLAVIEAFSSNRSEMTLSDLAKQCKLSPGSVRRVLVTLRELGYITQNGKIFTLAPRTLQLGYAYLSTMPIATLVQPRLAELTQALGETSSFAILDGIDVVYLARSSAPHLAGDYMSVGTRIPAYATSVGKVLLANLPEPARSSVLLRTNLQQLTPYTITDPAVLERQLQDALRNGYAINDQEVGLGLRSIAVPVVRSGEVVASLGVSAEVTRRTTDDLVHVILPKLKLVAAAVERSLHHVDTNKLGQVRNISSMLKA
jgi:IclR family pca regulon transcriptional regulator